jgi:hypothetical protein
VLTNSEMQLTKVIYSELHQHRECELRQGAELEVLAILICEVKELVHLHEYQ